MLCLQLIRYSFILILSIAGNADTVDGWHLDSIRDYNNLLNKPSLGLSVDFYNTLQYNAIRKGLIVDSTGVYYKKYVSGSLFMGGGSSYNDGVYSVTPYYVNDTGNPSNGLTPGLLCWARYIATNNTYVWRNIFNFINTTTKTFRFKIEFGWYRNTDDSCRTRLSFNDSVVYQSTSIWSGVTGNDGPFYFNIASGESGNLNIGIVIETGSNYDIFAIDWIRLTLLSWD